MRLPWLLVPIAAMIACTEGMLPAGLHPDASSPPRMGTDGGAVPDDDTDAGSDATVSPAPDSGIEPTTGPIRYEADRSLSPITSGVAARLREIHQRGTGLAADVFAKIGASASKSHAFMHCFAGEHVDLDGRDELRDAIDHFRSGDAGGGDPFSRESIATVVGWDAGDVQDGSPSPLEQELEVIEPAFAVVMYGTNDIGTTGIFRYAENMMNLIDELLSRGIVPLMTSIMPRDDDADADRWVPRFNLVVRGIAQAHQIPFIDFHRELLPLEDHGLIGDGIHPTVYSNGGSRGCVFTPEGLEHGYNIRNLLTIQTLQRVKDVVLDGEDAPDESAPAIVDAAGTIADPIVIDRLPFADLRNTMFAESDVLDGYPACDSGQDESGSEYIYRLELDRATTVRFMVADRGETDIDLHVLSSIGAESCEERDDREIVRTLEAGTWYIALDTFVSSGISKPGEFLFTVMEEN